MGEMLCEAPAVAAAEVPVVVPAVNAPRQRADFSRQTSDVSRFTPVLTLVLWLGCSIVAALGFAMPYVRPQAAKTPPEPLRVEMLNVELTADPLPEPELSPANPLAPPPPDAVVQPQSPPAVAVAMPSPSIAFAVPVEGPSRVVSAAQASYSRAESPSAAASPTVQQLTFGQGAGKQPAPEYPPVAERAGQEGSVSVRFIVAENGRVTAAEAVAPSPWPMLNDSALRTIRNRWRFPAGNLRTYEVAIRFQLRK